MGILQETEFKQQVLRQDQKRICKLALPTVSLQWQRTRTAFSNKTL